MHWDDNAVGGFFEDLPVLLLVLCGVVTIALASAWSSDRIADEQLDAELHRIVNGLADRVVESALAMEGAEYPMKDCLRTLNISRLASELPEGTGYVVSLVQVYPTVEPILKDSNLEKPVSEDACATSRLLNALDSWSRVVVVEVRVVVW